jgi:Flp pilus assembly protein TadD
MSRRDFGSILRTFREVFPHVSIWMGSPGDIILLGSSDPIHLDFTKLSRDISAGEVADDLARVGVRDVYAFMQGYLGGQKTLEGLTTTAGPIITDDNLLLEFSMPRNLYAPREELITLPHLLPVREPVLTAIDVSGLPPDSTARVKETLSAYQAARGMGLEGIYMTFGQDHSSAVPVLEMALERAPTDPLLGHFIAASRNEMGIKLLQGGQDRQALAEFARAAAVGDPPERALALNNIGLHHYGAGLMDSAGSYWERAASLDPDNPTIRYNLALVYDGQGQRDRAEAEYRAVIDLEPENSVALNNLAWILVQGEGRAAEAVEMSRRAVRKDPSPGNLDTHGVALYRTGQLTEAEAALRRAIEMDSQSMDTWFHLGEVLHKAGRTEEARAAMEKVVKGAADQGLVERARQRLVNL